MSSSTSAGSSREPVLVTGAAGFVGGHLAHAIARSGRPVVATDVRESDGFVSSLPNVQWRCGDLTDPSFVRSLLAETHAVVHAAGTGRAKHAVEDPTGCFEATLVSGSALLDALAEARPAWMLLLSTRAINELEGRGGDPTEPTDVYAIAKRAVEELSRCRCVTAGVPFMAPRLSDVYGSARDHSDKLLPTFIRRACSGQPLEVNDDTSQFFFVHVDDVIRSLLECIRELERGVQYVARDLWTEPGVRIADLAALVKRVCGSSSEIRHTMQSGRTVVPCPPRKGADGFRFRPSVSLEEGTQRLAALLGGQER
jgi:nucleoside-diphosphate-sugar epimerase